MPFLYTQGQCIGARSMLPCQDTPSVRCPVEMVISVPRGLVGVAGAILASQLRELGGSTQQTWHQEIPIPSYLIAFAIGDLSVRRLSDRSSVYAESGIIDQAAEVFADVEEDIRIGEKLLGPYIWGEFNIVVLPAAFPFGGMENPGAVFVNAAVAAKDKSQLEVIIHELAHHWSGNRVINASWDDFWLNEGWTVMVTYLIMEERFGREYALLQLALMEVDLIRNLKEFANQPWLTTLKTELHGIDPLEVFSRVPYMRGCFFLLRLRDELGEKAFMILAKKYIERFDGRSLTTEDFLDFLSGEISATIFVKIEPWRWCYGAGMPESTPKIRSKLMDTIVSEAASHAVPSREATASWNGSAWTYYLSQARRDPLLCVGLRDAYALDESDNPDVVCEYFLLAMESGAWIDWKILENFLASQGRVKYLHPLYLAYVKVRPSEALATFYRLKDTYHAMAVGRLDKAFSDAAQTLRASSLGV